MHRQILESLGLTSCWKDAGVGWGFTRLQTDRTFRTIGLRVNASVKMQNLIILTVATNRTAEIPDDWACLFFLTAAWRFLLLSSESSDSLSLFSLSLPPSSLSSSSSSLFDSSSDSSPPFSLSLPSFSLSSSSFDSSSVSSSPFSSSLSPVSLWSSSSFTESSPSSSPCVSFFEHVSVTFITHSATVCSSAEDLQDWTEAIS